MERLLVCACGRYMVPVIERDAYRCDAGHVMTGQTLVTMSRDAFRSMVSNEPRPITRETLENAMQSEHWANVGIEQGMASASRVNAADDEINAEIDAFYELINGQREKQKRRVRGGS